MKSGVNLAIATLACVTMVTGATAAPPNFGKCTSIQARCAIEIGGRCNPRTGYWQDDDVRGYATGATTEAFDVCISRGLTAKKK